MSDKEVIVTLEQMRAIARYELNFLQIAKANGAKSLDLVFPDRYSYSLDDLYAALKNIADKDPTVGEFYDNWYHPIAEIGDKYCIEEACGWTEDGEDEEAGGQDDFAGLSPREEDVFRRVWYGLEDIWCDEDEDVRIAGTDQFRQFIKDIERFLANKGKPVEEMDLTDAQKENFILQFEDDDRVKNASEPELDLCRKFTEDLCSKGSETALHLKGYACYGGNRLYGCDWRVSRDCMIRLFEKTDDPQYANTLGYIYYYGRCNGGVPEYEKAFESFTVSAANGLHEGIYKLADMFLHGYACNKSERTARALYGMAYEDCYKQYLEGREGAFADAALRMGNVYRKGIGGDKDPESAYICYLQADSAAKERAKHNNFFGDTNVLLGIRNALDETKAELPEDYFGEYVSMDIPTVFWTFCEKGYRVGVTVRTEEDGRTFLDLKRLPRRGQEAPEPVMLNYPTVDCCDLVTEIELESVGLRSSFGEHPIQMFRYDSCEWNNTERRIDFFYDDSLIGWMACDEYRFYNPDKTEPSGQLLRFAAISFQPNGRTYDYLCDIDGVEAGDRVIVMGYDGETEVTVRNVYTRYESELGLPLERYKKIIRKT